MRQARGVLGEPLRVEPFQRLDDPCVQLAPALVEEAPVRDFLGEGVAERELGLREQACLVQELGGLEMGQAALEILFGHVGDGSEERERDVLADDGGLLQQALVIGRQAIDPRGENGLYRGRDLDGGQGGGEAIVAGCPGEGLALGQAPHHLLEEERVALGPGDEQALQRDQPLISAEERVEHSFRRIGGEGVEPQLAVVRLAGPAMLVLGAVVHDEEDAGQPAGSPPSCPAALVSRRRSSGDPRAPGAGAGPGFRARAGSSRPPRSVADASPRPGGPTRGPPRESPATPRRPRAWVAGPRPARGAVR